MKLSFIEIGGEKRPVCFSLSAIEAIEDEFGSLDGMREALTAGKVSAINKVLETMLRAGRAYCEGTGTECPPPLKCRPGDLIDATDTEIVAQIFSAMTNDTGRTVEVKAGKN